MSSEEVQKLRQELVNPPLSKPVQNEVISLEKTCIIEKWTFSILDPATSQYRDVLVDVARPQGRGPFPFVSILPTIAEKTVVEKSIQDRLCRRRMASGIINLAGDFSPAVLPGWETHDDQMKFAVHAVRSLMDYVGYRQEIDDRKLGIFGASLGGIIAALTTSVDDRIKASFQIASAGNLPEVMTYSEQEEIETLKNQRMRHLGLKTEAEHELEARKHIRLDPIFFASPSKRDLIEQVMIMDDKRVPTRSQDQLWNQWGRPTRYKFTGGHVPSIVSFAFLRGEEAVNFYAKKFNF
jgi:hypothetical protein